MATLLALQTFRAKATQQNLGDHALNARKPYVAAASAR